MAAKKIANSPQIRPWRAERDAAQRTPVILLIAVLAAFKAGCGDETRPELVIYTSVDQQFAASVIKLYEQRTGVKVQAVFDTEAAKTTGLVRRLLRETARPRCDVWWSSEPFGTIELARKNVFEPYESPAAADIPDEWKDPQGRWTGFAARARVLAYHTDRVDPASLPRTWRGLAAPEWSKRLAIANPQFGTTRGHVAAMFAYWGESDASQFLRALRSAGCSIEDGNSMAVQALIAGRADICMTDTDDVWVAQRRGQPVEMIYPTLEPGGPIMWIPNTVALVRGGPNPVQARRLIDFLLSAEVERALLDSDSRNIPVRVSLNAALKFDSPVPSPPDCTRISDALTNAMRVARDILLE